MSPGSLEVFATDLLDADPSPATLVRALNGLLTRRAAGSFPGRRLPPAASHAIARCGRLGDRFTQDAAVLLTASLTPRIASKIDPDATIVGAINWLDELTARDDVIRGVWTPHRGPILYALEVAARSAAVWRGPSSLALIRALLDLLVFEVRQAVGLRRGLSFLVFEQTTEALGGLLSSMPEDGERRVLMGEAATQVRRLAARDWSEVRRWAADLDRRGLDWPGTPARPPRTPNGPARIGMEGVPFDLLCGECPAEAIVQLGKRFGDAARIDIRIYDQAPLAVAMAAVLRDSLAQEHPQALEAFDAVIARSKDLGWTSVVDAAAFLTACAGRNRPARAAADVALAWVDAVGSHPLMANGQIQFDEGELGAMLIPLLPTLMSVNTPTTRAHIIDLLVREHCRPAASGRNKGINP